MIFNNNNEKNYNELNNSNNVEYNKNNKTVSELIMMAFENYDTNKDSL